MRHNVAVLVLALTATGRLAAQTPLERVTTDLKYLADDRRDGRGLGTPGLDSAGQYIAEQFARIGLQPGEPQSFFQTFAVDSTAPMALHMRIAGMRIRNVVGVMPGSGRLAGQAVVIGAHYDHLGYGGPFALDPESTGVVHNGADDNASGTAALMEIARRLEQRHAADARTVVFVAFTGEEEGLLGSTYYVKHPVRPLDSTYAMINLDMVGRLGDRKLTIFGTATAREFPALLDSVTTRDDMPFAGSGDGYGASDQEVFYADSVPVLFFFSGMEPDYHKSTDDWQKIDFPGLVRIAQVASDVAWQLATRATPLTLVEVPRPKTAMGGEGYGAYLGTIPDMSESPGGVLLSGVTSGSPADQAGLKGGDILVQLGDQTIKNLYDMTDALRAHKPGETVLVVYLRDGKRIETKATLGKRGG